MARVTGLRKREIVFALAAGALAAGGAALILDDDGGSAAPIAPVAPQTRQLAPFEELTSVGAQDIVVTLGEAYRIRSEGSPEALGRIEAVVEDGVLVIRPKERLGRFNWNRGNRTTFHVTVPRLEAISLAGSGDARVDRIEGDSFEASVAGSGELAIDAMQVERADFTIAGSGNVSASGTAREMNVSILGSGDVRARDLRSETADLSIAGSGDARLTVSDEADVSIMGSGDVAIAGTARCSVSRMGSGDVRCEGPDG